MRTIILKSLALTNFKGISRLDVEFNPDVTSICGRNGLGKTTIFDAFTWLLFGKDSQDRKQFNIKTLDPSGHAIERLPHEVQGVLEVDGETIELRRTFTEKWTKKRGTAEEVFTGHEEERFYNNVPMSVKEWSEKIEAILSEQTFKFITNPFYFTSQKKEVQRDMLFRMAGTVSDEEIAAGNQSFAELLSKLTGKTIEEYKREIAAKKKVIKDEVEALPERIDECRRNMPESENWDELENLINATKEEIAKVDGQVNDIAKQNRAAAEARMKVQDKINNLKLERQKLANEITAKANEEYYNAMRKKSEIDAKIQAKETELQYTNKSIEEAEAEKTRCEEKRTALIAEWNTINARKLVFNDDEFICPTCKRPLDVADIESKQAEMTENFNRKKAADLEENKRKGMANNEHKAEVTANIEKLTAKAKTIMAEIDTLKHESSDVEIPSAKELDTDRDGRFQAINEEIAAQEAELAKPYGLQGQGDLLTTKAALQERLEGMTRRIAIKGVIDSSNARIEELTKQLQQQNAELARLEGIEFTIAEFSKEKVERIEGRINSMFGFVRFKMFEQQINGGEVETCEAMVDGVPYSDINSAMKINSGFDIINAICKFFGVTAPVFVDNAESVNEIIPTTSQIVRLVVTNDDKLTVK